MKNSKTIYLLALLFFFLSNTVLGQLPRFIKEKITITIKDNSCQVIGDYFFRNNHSNQIRRSLYYPFPVDSTIFFPDSIQVFDVKKNKNISFVIAKTGIYFPIEIPAGKTVQYEVIYTQKVSTNKFEYILTTTQNWGRPLEKAEFIIKIPLKFELRSLSYEHDEKNVDENFIVYKIHETQFIPKKNLIVQWARRLK